MSMRHEVDVIQYKLETGESVGYKNPPSLTEETSDFSLRLENDILICEMKGQFPTLDAARAVVEPYLREWEVLCALTLRDNIQFKLMNHEMRSVETGDHSASTVVLGNAGVIVIAAFSGKVFITRSKYPEPPQAFSLTPDVKSMWDRYLGYTQGQESLLNMAYFCLTVLENMSGATKEQNKREQAAKTFGISKSVVKRLGALSSEHGDDRYPPRKANPKSPLSDQEAKWIEEAVRQMILRAGEYSADPNNEYPQITMADLPELT